MTHVILVRHCESASNAAGDTLSVRNAPLSPRGREQALTVEATFLDLAFDHPRLITSPLLRALDTAAAVERALNLTAETDERLSAGESIGTRLDLKAPETLQIIGVEVLAALTERAAEAGTLIVVSHRYPMWALLTCLTGDGARAIMDKVANGDRLEFRLSGDRIEGNIEHRPLAVL